MASHRALYRLRRAALLGAAAAATWVAGAQAQTEAARLVLKRGDVTIDGATLRTGSGALAQLALADGATLALGPDSEVVLSAPGAATLGLRSGGLRLDATPARSAWRVELTDRSILTNGYLELAPCAQGCTSPPGLYGRVSNGEAVLEYQGGRAVMRNRAFYWASANARPEVLPRAPALLDAAADHADAIRARAEIAELLRTGLEAFRDGNDELARQRLQAVQVRAPGDAIVDYYLGLIALRQGDQAAALTHLQSYARQDPEAANEREVGKTLTLLSSAQLQQEVQTAVAREREVASSPPEPNSIAVNAFVNRGDPAYRPMAKGIAAMIIADLSKVPGLKVLEREKVQLLVNEMKLGDAGLADPATAVRSGRLMRAEKVIVGNFEVAP
jgi:hypothetical protein